MEMIKIDETGQMYIDFDGLEVLTNKRFSDRVRTTFDMMKDSNNDESSIKVDIEHSPFSVDVLICDLVSLCVLSYSKDTQEIMSTVLDVDNVKAVLGYA